MPLKSGNTKDIIEENISLLVEEGKTPEQALAIALSNAGIEDTEKEENTIEVYNRNLDGVKIFTEGVFNGIRTTKKDLNDMVEAFKSLGERFTPFIKLTHKEYSDNRKDSILKEYPFAVGEIKNLRLEDNYLVGDFKNIPESIYNLIKEGGLRSLSAEIINNLKTSTGDVYRRVLDCVALLGNQREALWEKLPDLNKYSINIENKYKNNYFEKRGVYQMDDKNKCSMTKEEYMKKASMYMQKGIQMPLYSAVNNYSLDELQALFDECQMMLDNMNASDKQMNSLNTVMTIDDNVLKQVEINIKNKFQQEYALMNEQRLDDEFLKEAQDNGKITKVQRDSFKNIFQALNNSKSLEVIKYSLNGKDNVLTIKEELKSLINSLNQRSEYSLSEMFQTGDKEIDKYSDNIYKSIPVGLRDITEGIDIASKIESYAKKHNIDISSEASYLDVMNKIGV